MSTLQYYIYATLNHSKVNLTSYISVARYSKADPQFFFNFSQIIYSEKIPNAITTQKARFKF